jgi:hypothetical protein
MYLDVEVTPEDEEEMIRKIANTIHQYGMEVPAILMVESIKPLTWIGSQMGRVFLSPFLPAFGEDIGIGGEKFLQIFEKRENVEKLLDALEELAQEEEGRPKEEGGASSEEASAEEPEETTEKKGWRRFLPF